jgi:triphosphoribosyl-dephospho-CoA synthase
MTPKECAKYGVFSLLLEVSATPKPGNVDRDHDLDDLKYGHFLISSCVVYPTFVRCAKGEKSLGSLILEAVEKSYGVCGVNVHFGSFVLLMPLIRCIGDVNRVKRLLKETTYRDSLSVLKAYEICKPRVLDVQSLSLRSEGVKDEIISREINLYEWMNESPWENIVARELVEGYRRSLEGRDFLVEYYQEHEDLNLSIVYAYLNMLSNHLDPLVIAKFGLECAEKVRDKASKVLIDFERGDLESVRRFDVDLVENRINPGSVADLTACSIFLALVGGLI